MKFSELSKSLMENLAPFYVLEGEEVYFLTHAERAIREACKIKEPSLNCLREEGENLKGEKLSLFCDSLYTLPFFDEKRFVKLCDYHPSEREWSAGLKKYASNPCPSTVLVLLNHEKVSKAVDFKKEKGIIYVDCSRADEETLTRWLYKLFKRMELEADTDAVEKIVRYCASDAARIKMEAEKLRLLLKEGEKVTSEIVERYIERDAEYKIYELTQASARGDFTLFTQICDDLLKKGFDEGGILSSLASYYKTLTLLSLQKGRSDAEAALNTGQKPYAVKKNREILRRLTEERAEELFLYLKELLGSVRAGNVAKSKALTAAVAKIFFE